jgi:hypothetical protein
MFEFITESQKPKLDSDWNNFVRPLSPKRGFSSHCLMTQRFAAAKLQSCCQLEFFIQKYLFRFETSLSALRAVCRKVLTALQQELSARKRVYLVENVKPDSGSCISELAELRRVRSAGARVIAPKQ